MRSFLQSRTLGPRGLQSPATIRIRPGRPVRDVRRMIILMFEWADDLKIRNTDLYLDSCRSRELCFMSHAHSDHIARHARAIATPETAALAEHRLGAQS